MTIADTHPTAGHVKPEPAVTFTTMGTVASFRSPDPRARVLVPDIAALFTAADERFSLYTPDSELSRINAGQLRLPAASQELRDMYAPAVSWDHATRGGFTPTAPNGSLDLNGVVKAAALAQAAELLSAVHAGNWCLNVGGDIIADGNQHDGTPWTIGVTDPTHPGTLLGHLATAPDRSAVATSGVDQRGNHIWRKPRTTARQAPVLIQATVSAADIIKADVLATAVISAGPESIRHYANEFDVDILAVDSLGAIVSSHAQPNQN